MKKITIFFFIILTIPIYAQWVSQNSGVSADLNDVYCIDENNVIVVGNAGTILKTTDGGENWIQKSSGTTADLKKVQFPTSLIGYAAGANGTLLKTIDKSENWTPIDIGETSNISDLSCLNENTFYIANGGLLKKTVNGGSTFETLNTNLSIDKIQFLNEQTGYASNYETLYKTVDGGTTWSVIIESYTMNSFFFIDENKGFIYTINGNYKTIDGGLNLSPIGFSGPQAQDLFAFNENVVWEANGLFLLCGCPPEYCITKKDIADNSESQEISNCNLSDNPDFKLNAIYFANETHGYTVGAMGHLNPFNPNGPVGAIYKNSTGIMLDVNEVVKKDAIKIYPNPSSDQITISFDEAPTQPFAIEITDSLGKQIYSKSYQAENTAIIDVTSFSKGLYFLTIVSNEKRQTQKVIVN